MSADCCSRPTLDSITCGRVLDPGQEYPRCPCACHDTDMVCEVHPDTPWPHENCPGPGMLAQTLEQCSQPMALIEVAEAASELAAAIRSQR